MGEQNEQSSNEEQTPQYVTQEQFAQLNQTLQNLSEKIEAGQGGALDQEYVKLYNELMADDEDEEKNANEEGAAYASKKDVDDIKKTLTQMNAAQNQDRVAAAKEKIDAQFSEKYDDWMANKEAIWKLVDQHPTLTGDQVYVIWKMSTMGVDALTGKEAKVAKKAAEKMEDASSAASEKPGSTSSGKKREYDSMVEMLKEEYDQMPAKPQFT